MQVPGIIEMQELEIVYFEVNEKKSIAKQFKTLTTTPEPRHAKNGAVTTRGCRIVLPDGRVFQAIGYHGDVGGWRLDIQRSAQQLDVMLAKIIDGKFVLGDGAVFDIDNCHSKFEGV